MPVKILIPASEVKDRQGNPLVLENEQCCSRCNQSPAGFYEIHRLHYRIGFKHNHLYGKKYRISKSYRLKISVCETCFQSDFLTHPDLLDHNNSPLAKIARSHSIAWTVGGLLAASGFLLLTPFIPANEILSTIKQMWQVPVTIGVLVLFLTWINQRKYQSKVLSEIEKSYSGFRPLARAEVHTYVLQNEDDLSATALEIILQNDLWAEACARNNQWKFKQPSTPDEETLHKG
ncbi:MAG: hypothetical protein Q8R87_01130 [Anaerolineaceae bacterium]|nr:hypothetical protein [Anaerolineaceae bacterium]